MRSKFDSLHESLCDISPKLDLLSLPSSQAAPDLPNADLQSPQSLVASNFLPGLSTQKTSFATARPGVNYNYYYVIVIVIELQVSVIS